MAKQPQQPIKVVHKWPDGRELTPEELEERRRAMAWATITEWAKANGYTVSFDQETAAGE